jgi:N,N'-diacetyllegionaminate synthase
VKTVRVDDRTVGDGAPCFVVAEVGANHNRDFELAKRLIDVAAEARADAVKFQTYSADTLYSRTTPRFKYLKDVADTDTHALLKSIELPRDWQARLADYAREKRIMFFSSPFDTRAVDELDEIGVPLFKIASFELMDLPLIEYTASKRRPVVLSTGMATMGEIEDALLACRKVGNDQVILLQCASLYPSPPELINLRSMDTMRAAFGCPVGLSDHTLGISVAIAAAARGAAMLEKHFTLDRGMKGPDHPFAIEPTELRALVAGIRDVEKALGDGRKVGPSEAEADEMYRLARRSLVAACPIPRGTPITREMLTVKRPGFGIKPVHLEIVIGRPAKVDIGADDVITWDMV